MSAPRLGVIGFGDFGRQICGWLAESGDQVADVVAFDDTISEAAGVTVAPFADALADRWGDLRFAVGLGYLHLGMRGQLIADLLDAGRAVASVVHPSAWVSPSATLGAGVVVGPKACVDQNAVIENGAIIHAGAVVCHDAVVGSAAYVGPGAVLCGFVRVGIGAFVGAGALVADSRTLGERCRIGIGSAVSRDVSDGSSVIGNPLRELSRPLRL